MNTASLRREYLLPGAIVLGGLILAFAIYAIRTEAPARVGTGAPDRVRAVTPVDRMIGNPEAGVKIITYADIDSPHSKTFQATMQQVMSDYATDGRVAWVYRHFPLLDQYVASASHAEAAECAGFIGGNDSFWRFIDALQTGAPGESQFPVSGYATIAHQLGIPFADLETCLTNGRFTQKVYSDSENALAAGAKGAPYIILMVEGQNPLGIQGGLSYEDMTRVIEESLIRLPS